LCKNYYSTWVYGAKAFRDLSKIFREISVKIGALIQKDLKMIHKKDEQISEARESIYWK